MIVLLKIIPFFHHFHPGLFQETPFAEIVGQAYENAAAGIVLVSVLHIFGGCDVVNRNHECTENGKENAQKTVTTVHKNQ